MMATDISILDKPLIPEKMAAAISEKLDFIPAKMGAAISEKLAFLPPLLDKLELLRKRRIAKAYSNALIKELLPLKSPLQKAYEATQKCCTVIVKEGDKLTSRYCGNRWCYVCNRIRTAKLINGYAPVLSTMGKLYLVTLSRPNVKGHDLRNEVRILTRRFRRIRDRLRKRGIDIKGIRKLEITYNRKRNDYHPHIHCIISGKKEAYLLRSEWLKEFPEASMKGNDIKPTIEGSLKEIFKYCSKIKDNTPVANDTIFQAISNRRIVQSMGIKIQVSEEIEELQAEEYDGLPVGNDVFLWFDGVKDWVSTESGFLLCEFIDTG